MKIGITYDMRSEYLKAGYSEEETAEFDRDDTISAIEAALAALGFLPDRIGHARQLIDRLARGDRWDLVFNIAEGLHGIGREAQVPAILDLFGIPYTFSDPLVMALTLHKGMTKRVVRDAGIPCCDFCGCRCTRRGAPYRFCTTLFLKTCGRRYRKRGVTVESIVRAQDDLAAACEKLISHFRQPVLVEQFLPGREFTVGIIGTGAQSRVLGTLEVTLLQNADPNVYSYTNKEYCEERVTYALVRPEESRTVARSEEIAIEAWRVLGCRDGGRVDIRCDATGSPQFMEVNPLAGLHPQHSDLPILCSALGVDYVQLIGWILDSATQRVRGAVNGSRKEALLACGCLFITPWPNPARRMNLDVLAQVRAVTDALHHLGHHTEVLACDLNLASVADRLGKLKPDLIFNLVESLAGSGRLIHCFPAFAGYLGDALHRRIGRSALSDIQQSIGQNPGLTTGACPRPNGSVFCGIGPGCVLPDEADRPRRWIIKSVWEHASMGLDETAIVEGMQTHLLPVMMAERAPQLGGACFAEAFIEGREFNLSLIGCHGGPKVLPPAEIIFEGFADDRPRIVDYSAKWHEESYAYHHTPRHFDFEPHETPLLARLTATALKCWDLFELSGYARVDFRVDADNRPWVLEINTNPCISPDAGYAAAVERSGMTYDQAIELIVASAGLPEAKGSHFDTIHQGGDCA